MKTQVVILLAVMGIALAAPQNRRPAQRQSFPQQQQQQQQQQRQEEQQFTSRFNPSDNQSDNQNDFYQSQPQQQQQLRQSPQQRVNNNNNKNFASDIRSETTTFIPILRFDKEQTADGGYKTLWETGNNIQFQETGVLKSFGNEKGNNDAVVQQGSYSYTSPEGQLINVQYTADERGFRATGDHLPTPPPIPADIQKSLDIIYAGIEEQKRQGGNQQYQEEGQYNEEQYNPQDTRQFNNNNSNNNNNQQGNINFRSTGNRNNDNRGFRQ